MCWNGGMTKHSLHDRVPSQPIYIPIHYSHTLNLVEFPRINQCVSRELTFARRNAFIPRVFEIRVAGLSTFVLPSTAVSTAAGLAGFLKSAALATRAGRNSSRSSSSSDCRRVFCGCVGIDEM